MSVNCCSAWQLFVCCVNQLVSRRLPALTLLRLLRPGAEASTSQAGVEMMSELLQNFNQ